jgi:hypothetical protein
MHVREARHNLTEIIIQKDHAQANIIRQLVKYFLLLFPWSSQLSLVLFLDFLVFGSRLPTPHNESVTSSVTCHVLERQRTTSYSRLLLA